MTFYPVLHLSVVVAELKEPNSKAALNKMRLWALTEGVYPTKGEFVLSNMLIQHGQEAVWFLLLRS